MRLPDGTADSAPVGGRPWLVGRGTLTVLVWATEQDVAHDVGALRLAGYTPGQIGRRRGHPAGVVALCREGTMCRAATDAEVEQWRRVLDQIAAGRDAARTA